MLMSHFICQTVRNISFRLYSRPSSVTDGKQRDRNHPFSLLQCRQVGACVFITAGPITKLFAGGGGGEWRTYAMRDDEPRPVWMSPLITH